LARKQDKDSDSLKTGQTFPNAPKTIAEIAEATGFSRTTIRFVVTGQAERYRIKAETQNKIKAYVAQHGLVLNHAARSLRLQRSDAIGLVLPDFANPFFACLTAEMEELCRKDHLVLLTASSHDEPDPEAKAIRRLLDRGIDGLVIAACRPDSYAILQRHRNRCAVVMVDRAFADVPFPTVVSDNEAAAYDLCRAMFRESQEPIDFLCAATHLPSISDRINGFRAACAEVGLTDPDHHMFRTSVDDCASGARLMTHVIETRGGVPPVFLCSSLLMFEGALQSVRSHYGRLPPSLILGTFDHNPLLDFLPNRSFSVRQNEKGIAVQLFECLKAQRLGEAPTAERHVIPACIRRPIDAP